jgi:hypothetical protein
MSTSTAGFALALLKAAASSSSTGIASVKQPNPNDPSAQQGWMGRTSPFQAPPEFPSAYRPAMSTGMPSASDLGMKMKSSNAIVKSASPFIAGFVGELLRVV